MEPPCASLCSLPGAGEGLRRATEQAGCIKVFYHLTAKGQYRAVVQRQMGNLLVSGLYGEVHGINAFVLAEDAGAIEAASRFLLNFGQKVHILGTSSDTSQMERFTLENMRHHVSGHDKVLYLHSKGISYTPDSALSYNTFWWTLFMEHHLLQRHAECIALLAAYDVVGVKWENMGRADAGEGAHFSGNFWWARGSYILSLEPVVGEGYYDSELYIGSNRPSFYSLWQIPTKDGRVAVLHDLAYTPRHYVDASAEQRALRTKHS